jgi:ribosomal protein S19
MLFPQARKNLRKDNRAVSPAISTVIMTAALVVLVLVATSYANNILTFQLALDEFSANKQFMQSTGLQTDDVAWTIGRTETVQYTTKYGQVTFVPNVLNYTFEIYNGSSWQTVYNSTTGMILFNMPVNAYSLGNNYFSRMMPANNGSFLQWNASAPVSQVFATQEVPMKDGSYARIVAVPTVRVLNSTLITGGNYYKFYLPSLVSGSNPHLSQSLTLTGSSLTKVTPSTSITQVRINATALAAPSTPPGFNSAFFNFDHTTETLSVPSGSLVEFYSGTVSVSIGMVG